METILGYLKQPSTWRGLTALAGVVGVSLAPEVWEQIGLTVASIIALIEVVRNEKAK